MVLDPFLTVPDTLNMWILCLLCQGSFVLNFVVIRNIHFIIVFFLNDIIDILFHLSNTYVLYISGIVRSNAGDWWREERLRKGIKMCLEGQHSVWVLNLWKTFITKCMSQIIVWSPSNRLLFSSPFTSIWSDDSGKVKNVSIGQVEEDINDVIEEENDDKVNVADDDENKHEASLT